MAKAVSSKSKQNKPASRSGSGQARSQSKEQAKGKQQARGKEQTKAPSRWARARAAARRSPAARPGGAKAEKGGLRKFLRDVRVEMTKVTWPTRKDLIQSTIVVIVAVIIASAYTGVLDVVFSRVVDAVLSLVGA